MNLVQCNLPCCYEKEGYCKLNGQASISGEVVDGCAYFKKRDKLLATKKKSSSKTTIKRQELL